MKKQDKYLKRAISSIGVNFGCEEPKDEKELDSIIKEFEQQIESAKNQLEELKYSIETADLQLDLVYSLKRQMLVEKYKELNPKHEIQ